MWGTLRLGVVCIAVALLGACATNYTNKSPEEISRAVLKKDSEFDAQTTYAGPVLNTKVSRGLFTDYQYVRLVSSVDKKTGAVTHKVAVAINYAGGYRAYGSVSLKGGEARAVTSKRSDIGGCNGIGCMITEEFSFPVTAEDLASAGDGLHFRANAKAGQENILAIPGNYVAGHVAAVGK